MYKMMAIDLDGTLLNDEKEISDENIKWIRKAYDEKGVMTVITTGRTINSAQIFANIIGQDVIKYVIAQNGAIVKDRINDHYVSFNSINDKDIAEAIKILKKHDLLINLETDNYLITDIEKTKIETELYNLLGDRIKMVEDLSTYDFSNDKINIVSGIGDLENLSNAIVELEKLESILVVPISTYYAKKRRRDI